MREIKRQFYMRWDEMLTVLGMEAGFFLFGEIILGVVVFGVGEKESIFPLGGLMALITPVFVMVFVGMSSMSLQFNLAVGMGAARKRVVPAILGSSLVIDLTAAWASYLFYYLEQWIFRIVYAGIDIEFDLKVLFQWKYIFPVCLAVVALNAFMGVMFLKYGKMAFMIFWTLWMVVCIGGPRIGRLLKSEQNNAFLSVCRNIVDTFFGFSERGILTAVVLISAGVMFISWMLLRKQQVNI